MGHKRKASTPSPLKMLSILDARTRGITLPEIARRTQHSVSSIMRWHDKFGDEVAIYHALVQAYPEMRNQLQFEAHYPDRMLSVAPAVEETESDASRSSVHLDPDISNLFVKTNEELNDLLRNK